MPNTLIPIQTYTLTSSASSVTFSNIPQNYNDLQIVVSARTDRASVQDIMLLSFNGSTSSFSSRYLEGNGSSAGVYADQARGFGNACGANATASTFGNTKLRISNYASSNSKSWSSDGVNETNATAAFSSLFAGLWANAAAITSITLTGNSSNFVSGSTFTLYGVSNGVKATGGTVIVAGGYAYHTFTSTGSFIPNQKIKGAELLVLAGGGSGGGVVGGGGGAGGLKYLSSQTLSAGNVYTALVGAGGASITAVYSSGATNGNSGSSSVFGSAISSGGGGGGGYNSGTGSNGTAGGNGGGGGGGGSAGGTGGAALDNFAGGAAAPVGGGGGGGTGSAGGAGVSYYGGLGGNGTTAYTTWHAITSTGVLSNGVYFIGGGGSGGGDTGSATAGIGGGGRGGAGGNVAGAAATANTGGGGGGSGGTGPVASGAGGSGLIIVRYPLS